MAVTPVGNPYVESSDRVSDYPGASEALAERIDIVGVNPFANAAARDAAIPSPVQGQMCSLNDDNKGYRYDGSAWILFSGAGAANFTNTATGTFSSGGDSFKYLTITGSGTLVIDQAGFADVLVIGGGGNANSTNVSAGGGGAGGYLTYLAYLDEGNLTVTIGAGGGNVTRLENIFVLGGGDGAQQGGKGGSGGGAGLASGGFGGSGVVGLGNNGGNSGPSPNNSAGGGGGAGSAGVSATVANVGTAGGSGLASSITGTSTLRGGGGGGGGVSSGGSATAGGGAGGGAQGSNGTANTGGGGGGAGPNFTPSTGGSGVVIVRVKI